MKFIVGIASCAQTREEVFRLRYRAYLHEGAIEFNKNEIFSDGYDALSTSVLIYVAEPDGKIVGSLRFSVQPPSLNGFSRPLSCPEFLVFPEELKDLSADNRPIASGSRFSIEPNHEKSPKIAILLLLAEAKAAKASGAKWGIATARGLHVRLYERFHLRQISEPRRMPGLKYKYALLASDIDCDFDKSLGQFSEETVENFERTNGSWEEDIRHELSCETWLDRCS